MFVWLHDTKHGRKNRHFHLAHLKIPYIMGDGYLKIFDNNENTYCLYKKYVDYDDGSNDLILDEENHDQLLLELK